MTTDVVRFENENLHAFMKNAQLLASANLLPPQYRDNPGNILLAIEIGAPLGFGAVQSINGINIIDGKPSMGADMVAALIRKAGHKLRVHGDDQQAVAELVRADDPEYTFSVTWTLERAQAAGLLGKNNWKRYPAAMLKARAITEVAREGASDALYGVIYTPEELGAETDAEGEVIDLPATAVSDRPATQPPAAPTPVPDPAPQQAPGITGEQEANIQEFADALGLDDQTVMRTAAWVTRREVRHVLDLTEAEARRILDYLRGRYQEQQASQPAQQMEVIQGELVDDALDGGDVA